jgi:uridine phosphorylase
MTPMLPFFSPDLTVRIEPAAFVAHYAAYHGLSVESFSLRQTVVVTLIPALERRLLRRLGSPPPHPHSLQHQRLYHPEDSLCSTIASPMGAPMAVMLLEQLVALGARRFIYLGFCGALAPAYRIGDGFIPSLAIREEGTSYHYLPADVVPRSSVQLNAILHAAAQEQDLAVGTGPIWTTDAPFRETPHKIRQFQAAGVHAVDMEMAALFAAAHYRGCEIAALLLVSDECYHATWKPGFGLPRLRQACQDAVDVTVAAVARLASNR